MENRPIDILVVAGADYAEVTPKTAEGADWLRERFLSGQPHWYWIDMVLILLTAWEPLVRAARLRKLRVDVDSDYED